ncbi:unnamed protein product [Ilex paraguariensis]|uniref:Uncharacterized protein n=1 Tax=Ilex paraguariensis TaxID=185542 RepID=A0ABC8SLQ9_9AQUA
MPKATWRKEAPDSALDSMPSTDLIPSRHHLTSLSLYLLPFARWKKSSPKSSLLSLVSSSF